MDNTIAETNESKFSLNLNNKFNNIYRLDSVATQKLDSLAKFDGLKLKRENKIRYSKSV